jgi:hypothetical protein
MIMASAISGASGALFTSLPDLSPSNSLDTTRTTPLFAFDKMESALLPSVGAILRRFGNDPVATFPTVSVDLPASLTNIASFRRPTVNVAPQLPASVSQPSAEASPADRVAQSPRISYEYDSFNGAFNKASQIMREFLMNDPGAAEGAFSAVIGTHRDGRNVFIVTDPYYVNWDLDLVSAAQNIVDLYGEDYKLLGGAYVQNGTVSEFTRPLSGYSINPDQY